MSGVAGRTDYGKWEKKVSSLLEEVEKEDELDKEEAKKALGLDGKYAVSDADAEERKKAKEVKHAKKVIDNYRKREGQIMQVIPNLLDRKSVENEDPEAFVVRLTRDHLEAGKRVLTICDTRGLTSKDMLVLTQDLSHLESKMNANKTLVAKKNPEDAENDVKEELSTGQERTVFGLIKVFISNVHDCTISLRCKVISGAIEISHCKNLTLKIEKESTLATLQIDLCENICVQFHDAPSGKNTSSQENSRMFWGEDKDDRIFHAGVKQMKVQVFRDGFVDMECMCDYLNDGAVAVGNASLEECQFVTSVFKGELTTELVARHGSSTGQNARAMTQRELDQEKERREKAAALALCKAEDMIKIVDKDGNKVIKKDTVPKTVEDEVIEEVYTEMKKSEIDAIIAECEQNKTRGNEAFSSGEYGQALLLYTLTLDKADELPDKGSTGDRQLFPRHIVLANRSAAFLKLGEHEKALNDGTKAQELNPSYVKGIFRRGLALHAMGRYQEAIDSLAAAHKLEPKNKQIKQALQFAEVRLTQELRRRMGEL
jgi:Tetratricopeptide repeat